VLVLDQTDVYGSDEASFSLAGLMGSTDPQLNPNISPLTHSSTQQQQQQQEAGEQQGSLAPELLHLDPATQLVRVFPPSLPVSGVEVWSAPGADLGNGRGFILDLAPKVGRLLETLVALVCAREWEVCG